MLLSPLLYFLCYFCFFHSVKNYKESKEYLNVNNNKLIIRKVVIINLLITLLASIMIYKVFLTGPIESKLIEIVFIGLASLTVPHMILKAYLNLKKK